MSSRSSDNTNHRLTLETEMFADSLRQSGASSACDLHHLHGAHPHHMGGGPLDTGSPPPDADHHIQYHGNAISPPLASMAIPPSPKRSAATQQGFPATTIVSAPSIAIDVLPLEASRASANASANPLPLQIFCDEDDEGASGNNDPMHAGLGGGVGFGVPGLEGPGHLDTLTSTSSPVAKRDGINKIIPDVLYLSGVRGTKNEKLIDSYNIKAFLNVAVDVAMPQHILDQSPAASNILSDEEQREVIARGGACGGGEDCEYLHLPLKDRSDTILSDHFAAAFSFIRTCREQGKTVLLFCREGKSRSASIAIAFVMSELHYTYDEAFDYVRQCRKQVDPNISFCSQLSDSNISNMISPQLGPSEHPLVENELMPPANLIPISHQSDSNRDCDDDDAENRDLSIVSASESTLSNSTTFRNNSIPPGIASGMSNTNSPSKMQREMEDSTSSWILSAEQAKMINDS